MTVVKSNSVTAVRPKQRKGFWKQSLNARTALLYLLPSIILFSIFVTSSIIVVTYMEKPLVVN